MQPSFQTQTPQLPPRPENADSDPVIVEHERYIKQLVVTIKALEKKRGTMEQQLEGFDEYMRTERKKLADERKKLERDKMGDPTLPRRGRSKTLHSPLD